MESVRRAPRRRVLDLEKIKERKRELRVTHRAIGNALCLSREAAISKLSGRIRIAADELPLIADCLGMSIEEMFRYEDAD